MGRGINDNKKVDKFSYDTTDDDVIKDSVKVTKSDDAKKNRMELNFQNISDAVSRKITGMSKDNMDKYLKTDDNMDADAVISKLMRQYSMDDDAPLTKIRGRQGPNKLSDAMYEKMTYDSMKDTLTYTALNQTAEKVHEQQYIKKYVPQTTKVIDMQVKMIMSPTTQSRQNFDVEIFGDIGMTNGEITALMERKKFTDHVSESLENALSHGCGFMFIYPYKKMAEDILQIAGITKEKTGGKPAPGGRTLFKESIDQRTQRPMLGIDKGFLTGELLPQISLLHDEIYSEAEMINDPLKKTKSEYYSESPITPDVMSGFRMKMDRTPECYSEADGSYYLKRINGCHVEVLDNAKTVPIYINNELVGIYVVETNPYNAMKNTPNPNTPALNNNNTGYRAGITLDIELKENMAKIIRESLSAKFLADNKHVLASIDRIFRDVEKTNGGEQMRVRFIPGEYIVEFANFHRASQLNIVEPLAHYWALLMKNWVFTKTFYEKDKIVTQFRVDYDDDISSQAYRAQQALENIVPSPADILNLRKMYTGMINSHRIMVPVSRNGVKPFEIDRIEGQKTADGYYDDMTKLGSLITELMGFSYNLLDPSANADFAIQILSADANKAEQITSLQKRFNPSLNEAFKKILMFELGDDVDLTNVHVKFPEQRQLKTQVFNDNISKIDERIKLIVSNVLGEDADKGLSQYMTEELFLEYASIYVDVDKITSIKKRWEMIKNTKTKDGTDDGSNSGSDEA